jgi:hypothetical protein
MGGIIGIKSLPLLGSLFSSTDQIIQQTDVVLTITPYIIRNIPLEEEDFSPLWIPLEGISAAGGAERPPRVLPEHLMREARPEVTRPNQEEARVNRITLNPPGFETAKSRNFRINVNLRTEDEIQNMSLTISFDPQILKLKSISRGNVIQSLGEKPSFLENIDNASGNCVIGFSGPQVSSGFKGTGRIVTLLFEPVASGESLISISSYSGNTPTGQSVHFETNESRVKIR